MNHVYRLIWNANLFRWVVAPESAKGHGKNSSTVRSGRHAAGHDEKSPITSRRGGVLPDSPWCRRSLLCALLALQPTLILAQSITPDGRTQTTVSVNGAITNITTSTVRGANGFNSFQTFGVGAGTTANLFLPAGTQNLINLVRDQQTNIAGILNAIKDGRIGGNVYFANPNGFLVSASGVVNVGSLSVSAPTPAFVNNFFNASGAPNDSYVASLLNGTAPRNAEALISILGQVNAIDGISLSAGTINVGGTLYSGARFIGAMPDFSDVVNANGLASGNNVVVREGQIEIVADRDVNIAGTLAANGGAGVRGGTIGILAGGNIDLQNGAQLLTKGQGVNSDGGAVYVWAGNNATLRDGALIDASAGSSGNGGAIEFSAGNQVDLAGGSFLAGASNGQRGTVLIDPTTINVSSNFYAAGADYTLLADQSITVNSGVTISTRQVAGGAGADQDTASSTGDSGNIALSARNITLQSGSRLLAHATAGYQAGDITLSAASTGGQLDVLSDTTAQISLSGATVKGGDISFAATANHASSVSPVVTKAVSALIDIDSSRIVAQGKLDMNASATSNSSTGALPIAAAVQTLTSTAKVDVHGASQLTTTSGDASLKATSTVTTEAKPTSALAKLAGDGEVAISVVNSTASVHLGDTSQAHIAGKLGLTADNTVSTTSIADASAAGSAAAGASVAVSVINSKTTAYVDGQATLDIGDKVDLSAKSKNTAVVTAKANAKGAQKDTTGTSEGAKTLDKYKDTAKTSEGSASVAGAIAVSDLSNDTRAYIASSGRADIGGALALSSLVANKATVLADGSATSGNVGVGAAVGVNIGVSTNVAQIGDNTDVHAQGVSLSAVNIDGLQSEFSSEAKSGAGAGNVGVAGALAANVVVNTTVAGLEGDTDSSGTGASVNAGSGDVQIEAGNTTSSIVKSGASVTGSGTSAKVGVGATAGINVAINTTVAEIGDQAVLSGGKDLQLNATAEHTTSSEATGGAAGTQVAVTPVVAVALAVNTTSARLGESTTGLGLSGAYSSKAEQQSTTSSKATGQTQGDKVAVGASIGLTIATDTVTADVERNITADDGVGVAAKSTAKSSSTATASAKGGAKAKSDGSAGSTDSSTPDAQGKSVDEQVAAQGDAAKASGQKTAAAAPKTTATGSDAGNKLADTKSAPKTDETTQAGGVSVAAAVGINTGVATTTAKIGKGRQITSSNGALNVSSTNETDASAKADGSQVDSGNTSVGVGAAVALNVGVSTNVAQISDNAVVNTQGVTVSAVNSTGQKSDYAAEATSGAGAGNVGVAGSLAANVVVNTSVALIEGDTDNSGTGARVDAGSGDVLVEAANATNSTVKTGANVTGTDASAKVGVGASIGMDIAINTTVAEVADKAIVSGGKDLQLNATAEHTTSTEATGGAAGAQVAVTPVVAVALAVNTTSARLGEAATGLGLSGAYSSKAEQNSTTTSKATGQTQGDKVAVGASIGLTIATDTVTADVERNITADDGVGVAAKSTAKSSSTATASAKGGAKAKSDGSAGSTNESTPDAQGKSVDEQVTTQGDAAKAAGQKNADAAPKTTATGGDAGSKLNDNPQPTPKAETSEGGVTVAAAAGINVGVATTTAKVGKGRQITSSGGALNVSSSNETDTAAKADGSQVDGGNTKVGVGAAVALNVGVSTNQAVIGDNAVVRTHGLTVSAVNIADQKSDGSADAKSGAGASNVGVAGALALNTTTNTTQALVEGDKDGSGTGADIDAGGGDVLVEARNATTNTAKTAADVKMSGSNAKVGVGASIGVNVVVNTTTAEVGDKARLVHAGDLALNAAADHTMSTEVTGGAAGAKVSVTPVVAAAVAVNTTTARLGSASDTLDLAGTYSSTAEQTNSMTTKATGQAQGDVAVGASLAASIGIDHVAATIERDVDGNGQLDLKATSATSLVTEAKAGAKGAKAAPKNAQGEETPEAGSTVDEQKKNQLDFAKSRNSGAAAADTSTPDAKTPDTTEQTPSTDKPTAPPTKDQQGKKVSIAAAIGVGVSNNEAYAGIASGRTINTGTGDINIHAGTDTNYRTLATGEAVSDDVGIAAAVALTATRNNTQATLGAGTTIEHAGDINIIATSTQNRADAFLRTMSAEAVSGASGGDVAVAGSLAVVLNENDTTADIEEGASIGSAANPVGDVAVKATDTSKISAQARAGALSKGDSSKAGVGASFAVLLSYNHNTAAVGYDTPASYAGTTLYANSLSVEASKNRVWFNVPSLADAKNFVVNDVKNLNFDALDPSSYLGSNNYYTEAVAGAAAKGNAAVAGAFAVNIFGNTTEAGIGQNVHATLSGSQPEAVPGTPNAEKLGAEISAKSDTQAIAFSGAVAGAKKAGVGISNTDIVSLDETLASIASGSTVIAEATGAGVKVNASSRQDIANVSVSAGVGTESTGVGGVLGVIVSLNKSDASIGDNATVRAQGDVAVQASSDSNTVMVSGGVGGGKEVGVGAAVAANILANETHASIGKNAEVDALKNTTVKADAEETAVTAVVAGAGGGKAGVAAALSINAVFSDTAAFVDEGAKINTDAAFTGAEKIAIRASDDTVIVGIAGGGAGGGDVGVGASLDTTVLGKTVKAYVADDTTADGKVATLKADQEIAIDAASTENIVSVTAGFAGGGKVGVGGAVSVGVVINDVQASVGKSAALDSDGNVLVNAQDDTTAVLTAGSAAGGGQAGVGGSLAVATLLGSTKASIADNASVNARGLGDAATVYTGETVFSDTENKPTAFLAKKTESAKGLSVTAYDREDLVTTVASGAGGGTAGVAATVSANVIARTTEASVGRGVKINENNTAAGADQQVRVKAIDETLLVDTAAGAGGGGTAGVGAAANVGVVAKTTTAKIGKNSLVNAKKAVELSAASSDVTVGVTAGFAGGGSAGVGGALAAVGVANTTKAYIEDATSTADAAKVNVSAGDLNVDANEFSSSWLVTGAGAGGGAAGVGASLSVGVNSSTTSARLGDYAETNAAGSTAVHADSTENVNAITVAGAGGGAAGVAGSISVDVIVSTTEAGIGKHARVNQDFAGDNVDVKATDRIISVAAAGAGAGGGAAGVGGTAAVTVALNTTSAYIDNYAAVSADQDVKVDAKSEKFVNSATVAGAGGGAAGVAGAVSVLSVGSLLDGEAKSGLSGQDENGNTTTMQGQTDQLTTQSAVGGMLGSSKQSQETTAVLDGSSSKLAVSKNLSDTAPIPLQNTQAFIGKNAVVEAGNNVGVSASDTTLAILASGAGAGGGAAGVAGSLGVVLLHDSAEAFIGDGAAVDAGKKLSVGAVTGENVYNVGVTGSGAGAAAVDGAVVVNVVTSNTAAYIGDADINQGSLTSSQQSVAVTADSSSNLLTVAGSGGGAGAASVGGVLNVNTLIKDTRAYIGEGAHVAADLDVQVAAASAQNVIGGGVSIRGAGAAAVSGVISANVVDNTTEAFIGAADSDATKTATVVDSDGNVRLAATDDTLLLGISAIGNGAGAAAVGISVGANVISSHTRAYVAENSTVNARGNAAASDVYSGAISSTPGALPDVPGGGSGDIDANHDGVKDGSIKAGLSFNVKAESDGNGDGGADSTANPAAAKSSDGSSIAAASGGLGAKTKESQKGLSVVAMGNEKVVTTNIGVAGAGAAAVTGAATVNVISSTTEARIDDGTTINAVAGGSDPSVRVRAADNTFMVQTAGTVAGAGAAAVSGSNNTAVVDKTTTARVGKSTMKANNVEISAAAREEIYNITANVSVGGFAGVGAAVGVNVVNNTTTASIGAGADIDATGDLRLTATQDTALDLYSIAGAGGIAGVSGALSVGVVTNTTSAHVDGASDTAHAAKLNAGGTTAITAEASEDISSVTASAAGGGVGVAGAVGVKVVKTETTAYIGDNTQLNQTRGGATQDVKLSASDDVSLSGGGGAASAGAYAAGASAEVNIVRNTTTAYLGEDTRIDADRDIAVSASASKAVQSAAVAAAGGASAAIGGAVSVVTIGAKLDDDSQGSLRGSSNGESGDTASFADGKIKQDKVSGALGNSEHVQGMKSDVSGQVAGLGVAAEMNETSANSLDKTQAYIGNRAQVTAGRKIDVTAIDKTQLNINAAGAAVGYVGIGGALGIGITNSTTEAYVGTASVIDAGDNVTVQASAGNVDSTGSQVRAIAGAGGVVGLSAAVSVLDDSSSTSAHIDSNSHVQKAKTLTVKATTARKSSAETWGASVGGLAVGASVARSQFGGYTAAYLGNGMQIGQVAGKTVDDVLVTASDESVATAYARAGSAGILSGSGADAKATVDSTVDAHIGSTAAITAQNDVEVGATGQASTEASAIGVSAGAAAVGVSLATAEVSDTVRAYVDDNASITADLLTISAETARPAGGFSAKADSLAAAGGLLGVNGSVSSATYDGTTTSHLGANANITGDLSVTADSDTRQQASASGIAVGLIAAGAEIAKAESTSGTQAYLGNNVKATGSNLSVIADGTDNNFASAVAGSGGVVAGSAAVASTRTTSDTRAYTGSGDATHQLDEDNFTVRATHQSLFNGEVDSVNASLVGASGAKTSHEVNSTVAAAIGDNGRVNADDVVILAENKTRKDWLGTPANADTADWNIRSGSGGLIDAPAGSSDTHITHNTSASVGDNAQVHILPTAAKQTFNMDAYNEIVAHDKAKLDSGGAVAVAEAVSHVIVDAANATVSFGENAQVVSDLGNIAAGARAFVELDSRAAADVYGLAGAPSGEAYAIYNGYNLADVKESALLRASDGEVFLAGGQSSLGTASNITAYSRVNLWNKTAIPINTTPDAQSNIVSNARMNVQDNAIVEAAGDIALYADKGSTNADAKGIGKDIYRETAAAIASGISNLFGGGNVSFDITGGSSSVSGLAVAEVDGIARTGINRIASLTLNYQLATTPSCSTPPCYDSAGRVLWNLVPTTIGNVSYDRELAVGIAANIQKRIDKLRQLKLDYAGDSVAVAAYESEIKFLQYKLVELGLASNNSGTFVAGTFNSPSPRQAAQTQLTSQQGIVSGYVTTANTAASTLSSTTSNALGELSTLLTNAASIVSKNGDAGDNNNSIVSKLQSLSGYASIGGTNKTNYDTLVATIGTNNTLASDITSQRTANLTDQSAVNTKVGQINSKLGEIDTRTSQINNLAAQVMNGTNLAAANQIVTLQAEIDTRQADIKQLASDIKGLLSDISTRDGTINSKSAQIITNNTTINSLETSLASALSNAGEATTVSQITALRSSNTTLYGDISTLSGTNSSKQSTVASAVTTVTSNSSSIAAAVTSTTRSTASDLVATLATDLPGLSNVAASGATADFITVNDISVRLGSIRTKGDQLIGTGQLRAPGDAQINITNNTPDFLIIKNLTINSNDGGTITHNGVLVNSNDEINRINRGSQAANFSTVLTRDSQGAGVQKPSITITSNYDPNSPLFRNLPAPAPDIELQGDITNLRGSVNVLSKAGSILTSGSINAGTVNIKAENGDFVQSYVDGFSHVGGDPASIRDEGTALGEGIIANGSVVISARYLNVNSLIQSGIEQWALTLPAAPVLTGTATQFGIDQSLIDSAVNAYKNTSGPRYTVVKTLAGKTVTYDALLDRLETTIAYADADRLTADWATRTSATAGLYQLVSDYGNITAYYDPSKVRYEVNGTQVRGGYIQLFGQILNTTDNTGTTVGKLRVLDGYGQIKITNPTALPVVINTLDTGADPTGTLRGTAGKIDITDIQSVNADNTSEVIHTVYTRNYDVATGAASLQKLTEVGRLNNDGSFTIYAPGTTSGVDSLASDSRNTSYSPQSGLRYVWTTGTTNETYTYWQYSGAQFFGIESLRTAPSGHVESKSGPFLLSSFRLSDGTYLTKETGSTGTPYKTSTDTRTTSDDWSKTAEWTKCNWWTLCIAQNYYSNWTETTGTKSITTKSQKGDYPIAIQFSGYDQGSIAINSASDVLLNGAIRNASGDTVITAGIARTTSAGIPLPDGVTALGGVSMDNKSIIQASESALITSRNLTMNASGSVGAGLDGNPAQAIQTSLTGKLDAHAGNGNVLVEQTLGDLKIGSVTAAGSSPDGTSRIKLTADGNIVADSGSSLIQAERVELTSKNGAIGSVATPLLVNVGYTDDLDTRAYYGLKAAAQGDIGIQSRTWSGNTGGDLLVDTVVSTGGDVKLVSPGRIIDNNPIESVDNRVWSDLLSYWDSLGLVKDSANNAEKQAQTVRAYENGKTQDYQLYWQLRLRQADPASYDPAYVFKLTPAEIAALPASTDIAAFEAKRTAQYHQLNATVGGYSASYVANYQYVASQAEQDQLLSGSSWTIRELAISVSPGMLKNITNTNPVVKSANVSGRKVTLSAAKGIGETRTDITIPYDVDPSCSVGPNCLTDAMKVALAAAERSDFADNKLTRTLSVLQRKPVYFDAATSLSVDVTAAQSAGSDDGNAYLASLGDAYLNAINISGDARIKVRGSIVNYSDSSPAVQTGNLILEAANGGIGYVPDAGTGEIVRPLRLGQKDGSTLVARAADDVDIVETSGDMNIDTVFSRQNVALTAQGSLLDAHAPLLPDDYVVRESELNVLGANIALSAQTGAIGSTDNALDVGVNLDGRITAHADSSGQGVYLNGPRGNSFNIAAVSAGDEIKLSSDLDMLIDGTVSGPGPLSLNAGGIMTLSSAADVHASLLTATLSAGEIDMAAGSAVTVDLGNLRVDSKTTLSMADGATLNVGQGTIDITTVGDAIVTGITTGNPTASAINITSTAGRILAGHTLGSGHMDIVADNGPTAKLTMNAALGIGDEPLNIRVGALKATSGGIVDIAEQDGVTIDSITAGDRIWLTAGGDIAGGTASSSGTGGTNPDKSVRIASTGGGVNLAGVSGSSEVTVTAPDDIYIREGQAGAGFTGQSSGGNLTLEQLTVGSSVFLYGERIVADIIGSSGRVTGAIGGGSGGPAANIEIGLAAPSGFTFSSIATDYGTIDSRLGDLWVDNLLVSHRLLIDNPQTNLLIDQEHRSMQPADVQLYSDGAGFRLGLWDNHVFSSALAIWNEPTHDVINADGSSGTAVDKANQVLNEIRPISPENENGLIVSAGDNVSISGTPPAVALNNPETADCDDILHCEK